MVLGIVHHRHWIGVYLPTDSPPPPTTHTLLKGFLTLPGSSASEGQVGPCRVATNFQGKK